MNYRRAFVGLVLLLLVSRVTGQGPTRTIPTTKTPATKTAQIPGEIAIPAEPGPLGFEGFPGGDCPPAGPGLPPIQPGFVPEFGDEDAIDPPAPQVRIRVRAPAAMVPGKELEYRLIVENTGKGAAHHTAVRVSLPPGVQVVRANPQPTTTDPEPRWQLGTLPGCGNKEITLVVMPAGDADVRVCARVSHEYGQCVVTRISGKPPAVDDRIKVPMPGPDPGPGPGPGPRPLPQPPMGNPNLTLRVTAPAKAVLFDPVTFVLEVANTGTGPARDVVVTATPTAGLEFSNAVPNPTTEMPMTWLLRTLAPGQRQRIELILIPRKGGTFGVEVDAETGTQKRTERAQVVVGEVKLDLIKKGPATRLAGSKALYVIQVQNVGAVDATNVVISDEIPEQIEFVGASPGGKLEGNVVRWNVGTLAPGQRQQVTLEVVCKVPGTLKNRAVVRADRIEKAVTAEAVTEFENVTGLTVEIDRNPALVQVDQVCDYTIRVINQGDGEVEALGVTVTLPPGLTLVDAMGPIEALKAADSATFPQTVKVKARETATYKVRAKATMPGEVKVEVKVTAKQLERPLLREEATTIFAK
jgi:uncharacterized repeat protein (TIGR01451 family)